MPQSHRSSVFVSYSHKDAEWLERLRIHLRPLERDERLSIWSDTNIRAGQQWRKEIADALATAKVAVLLISADFLASDFIATQELPTLLAAAQSDGAVILPVIIKPSLFQHNKGLSQFQAVNPPSEPMIAMPEADREQVLVSLAGRIIEIFADSSRSDQVDIESQDEEIFKDANKVFHPGNRSASRSSLEVCRFFVSPFYQKTKLWKLYGDIQIELVHDSSGENVFLIPSGAVAPHLRDTGYLRTPEGARTLEEKWAAAEVFVKRWRNQELSGYKFKVTTRTEDTRTKVYCAAYDECLVETIRDADDAEYDEAE